MDKAEKEHLVFCSLYLRIGGGKPFRDAFQTAYSDEKLEGWDRRMGHEGKIAPGSLVIFSSMDPYSDQL